MATPRESSLKDGTALLHHIQLSGTRLIASTSGLARFNSLDHALRRTLVRTGASPATSRAFSQISHEHTRKHAFEPPKLRPGAPADPDDISEDTMHTMKKILQSNPGNFDEMQHSDFQQLVGDDVEGDLFHPSLYRSPAEDLDKLIERTQKEKEREEDVDWLNLEGRETWRERQRRIRPPQFPDDVESSKALRRFSRTVPEDEPLPADLRRRLNFMLSDSNYTKRNDRHFMQTDLETWYLANRMSSVFSVLRRILIEIRSRIPSFAPKRVLDFAAGSNSALWATREVFYHDFAMYTAVERDGRLARLGQQLGGDLGIHMKYRANLSLNRADHPDEGYELVICSYALSKQPNLDYRKALIEALWGLVSPHGGLLLIVEKADHGGPAGLNTNPGPQYVREARDYLLKTYPPENNKVNASILGSIDRSIRDGSASEISLKRKRNRLLPAGASSILPCAHDKPCPISTMQKLHEQAMQARAEARKMGRIGISLPRAPVRECTFGQRMLRGPLPNQAPQKDISIPKHLGDAIIEGFSYVVMRKGVSPEDLPASASFLAAEEEFQAKLELHRLYKAGLAEAMDQIYEEAVAQTAHLEDDEAQAAQANKWRQWLEENMQEERAELIRARELGNKKQQEMQRSEATSEGHDENPQEDESDSRIDASDNTAEDEDQDIAKDSRAQHNSPLTPSVIRRLGRLQETTVASVAKAYSSASDPSNAGKSPRQSATETAVATAQPETSLMSPIDEDVSDPVQAEAAEVAASIFGTSRVDVEDLKSAKDGVLRAKRKKQLSKLATVSENSEADTTGNPDKEYDDSDDLGAMEEFNPRRLFAENRWARIVSPPIKRGGHVIFDLCTPSGEIERRVVGREGVGPAGFRHARAAKWGDVWPYERAKRTHEIFQEIEEIDPNDPEAAERQLRKQLQEMQRAEASDLFAPNIFEPSALDMTKAKESLKQLHETLEEQSNGPNDSDHAANDSGLSDTNIDALEQAIESMMGISTDPIGESKASTVETSNSSQGVEQGVQKLSTPGDTTKDLRSTSSGSEPQEAEQGSARAKKPKRSDSSKTQKDTADNSKIGSQHSSSLIEHTSPGALDAVQDLVEQKEKEYLKLSMKHVEGVTTAQVEGELLRVDIITDEQKVKTMAAEQLLEDPTALGEAALRASAAAQLSPEERQALYLQKLEEELGIKPTVKNARKIAEAKVKAKIRELKEETAHRKFAMDALGRDSDQFASYRDLDAATPEEGKVVPVIDPSQASGSGSGSVNPDGFYVMQDTVEVKNGIATITEHVAFNPARRAYLEADAKTQNDLLEDLARKLAYGDPEPDPFASLRQNMHAQEPPKETAPTARAESQSQSRSQSQSQSQSDVSVAVAALDSSTSAQPSQSNDTVSPPPTSEATQSNAGSSPLDESQPSDIFPSSFFDHASGSGVVTESVSELAPGQPGATSEAVETRAAFLHPNVAMPGVAVPSAAALQRARPVQVIRKVKAPGKGKSSAEKHLPGEHYLGSAKVQAQIDHDKYISTMFVPPEELDEEKDDKRDKVLGKKQHDKLHYVDEKKAEALYEARRDARQMRKQREFRARIELGRASMLEEQGLGEFTDVVTPLAENEAGQRKRSYREEIEHELNTVPIEEHDRPLLAWFQKRQLQRIKEKRAMAENHMAATAARQDAALGSSAEMMQKTLGEITSGLDSDRPSHPFADDLDDDLEAGGRDKREGAAAAIKKANEATTDWTRRKEYADMDPVLRDMLLENNLKPIDREPQMEVVEMEHLSSDFFVRNHARAKAEAFREQYLKLSKDVDQFKKKSKNSEGSSTSDTQSKSSPSGSEQAINKPLTVKQREKGSVAEFEKIEVPSLTSAWTAKQTPPTKSEIIENEIDHFLRGSRSEAAVRAEMDELDLAAKMGITRQELRKRAPTHPYVIISAQQRFDPLAASSSNPVAPEDLEEAEKFENLLKAAEEKEKALRQQRLERFAERVAVKAETRALKEQLSKARDDEYAKKQAEKEARRERREAAEARRQEKKAVLVRQIKLEKK